MTNNPIASPTASVEEAPVAIQSAESGREKINSLGETEVKFKFKFDPKALSILAGVAIACFIGIRVTNKAVEK